LEIWVRYSTKRSRCFWRSETCGTATPQKYPCSPAVVFRPVPDGTVKGIIRVQHGSYQARLAGDPLERMQAKGLIQQRVAHMRILLRLDHDPTVIAILGEDFE